jgi:hypothetical protein
VPVIYKVTLFQAKLVTGWIIADWQQKHNIAILSSKNDDKILYLTY